MRRFVPMFCFLSLMGSATAQAQDESAAEAPADPVETAEPAPGAEAQPQVAPDMEPELVPEASEETPAAPAADVEPAAVNEKVATLNLGGQVVFALAMQVETLKGLEAAMNHVNVINSARKAGAFSVVGGSWIDMQAVTSQGSEAKSAWTQAYEKFSPLKDVDPTDAAAVKGKKKELLAAIESAQSLVEANAGARKGELKEGLALFKLALDPPYAYGHNPRTIYAWTAASVGTMISMAGLGSLSNPLEREQGNFGWIATGVGLTTAGIGAALIVLDAK